MPRVDLVVDTPIHRSGRVMQVEGQFDLPPEKRRAFAVHAELPFEERDWRIGAVLGPSGSGKSTILRGCWGIPEPFAWDQSASVLDGFPRAMKVQDVTRILASIGFSSPPAWLRPFSTLSNGEQFRASVARALCEDGDPIVIDEFTSVVDRTVARIGAAAIGSHVRANERRLVVGSCHYDIVDWLQPDWVYDTAGGAFSWRCLQRRPPIELEVYRTTAQTWRLFGPHHYLTHAPIPQASFCTVALVEGQPASFLSTLAQIGHAGMTRGSRLVTLPDFQGVGIGHRLEEFVASLLKAAGRRYVGVTAHPSMIAHKRKSPNYVIVREPSLKRKHAGVVEASSWKRLTVSYEYVGPPASRAEAAAFGLLDD